MKKLLLAGTAACGALLLAPAAAQATPIAIHHTEWPAEDDGPYGWNAYSDHTSTFYSVFDPAAWFGPGSAAWYPLVISPYGTAHPIECRGDGHYQQIHACQQLDGNGNWHELDKYSVGSRDVYAYR